MGRHNVNFEISIEDMELIETALRQSKSELSEALTEIANPFELGEPSVSCDVAQKTSAELRRIHDLLGRLHNQKVFFRPKQRPFISG